MYGRRQTAGCPPHSPADRRFLRPPRTHRTRRGLLYAMAARGHALRRAQRSRPVLRGRPETVSSEAGGRSPEVEMADATLAAGRLLEERPVGPTATRMVLGALLRRLRESQGISRERAG